MILFGLLGSTMGMFEETYGLIPVFISIAMALGYDALVGGSVIYLGVAVGFAAATINPFTIGIAQEVAGVKMFSGLGYRILCFVVFMGISIWYVWRYARRIQKDPTKSYLYGEKIETLGDQDDNHSQTELSVIRIYNWYTSLRNDQTWLVHRRNCNPVYYYDNCIRTCIQIYTK